MLLCTHCVAIYRESEVNFNLQINREDKNTGYFPLFQARSLQEKKDDALTELAELKKLMSVIVEHHQEEVDNRLSSVN